MALYIRSVRNLALSAAVWALLFAAINLYWGLGGTFGVETLGQGIAEMADARDAELLLFNWISVGGKFALGLLALALLRPWRKRISYFLHVSTWIAGILLTFYGVGNLIQHALMLTGSIPVARLLGSLDAVRWHMLLWDPVWLIGGVLFLLLARNYQRTKRVS